MAEFSRLVITNKGQALLAKMILGEGNIEFTKVSASNEVYLLEQLEMLTILSDVRQTALISKVSRTNEVAITVETTFNNIELKEGYHMRALGLYALDPDDGEILYAVTREVSGSCYMPAYNGITVSGAYIRLVTTVGNAENVSLEVDPAAIATIGDMKALRDETAKKYLEKTGDSSDNIVYFEESAEREEINSGEEYKHIFGKIKKWLSDLEKVSFTGSYKDLKNKPNLKPIDAENRIDKMTSINQITSIGFWTISAIENNYANIIGIDNNVGDFYAIVSNYNGNGTDHYNYGDLLLFSPRLQGYHYAIDVWEGNARARLVLTSGNILTTKEQINANTSLRNVAGAMAVKEMFSEINSNLTFTDFPGGTVIDYIKNYPHSHGCFCIYPKLPTDFPAAFSSKEGYLQIFKNRGLSRVIIVYWTYPIKGNILIGQFYDYKLYDTWKILEISTVGI